MYQLEYEDAVELLGRHGIHAPVDDERYLRHAQIDRGVPIGIEAFHDENGQAFIALRAHKFGTFRVYPITLTRAESMIDQLHTEGRVPVSGLVRLMLIHLLIRSSKLFVEEALEGLLLDPIYVRENDYCIGGVKMFTAKERHLRKRLAKDAHDRGAVFAYRPTARVR